METRSPKSGRMVNARCRPWGHPANWRDPAKGINRSPYGFGGAPGAGGANFVMADASVRFVSERIDESVLREMSGPPGADPACERRDGASGGR